MVRIEGIAAIKGKSKEESWKVLRTEEGDWMDKMGEFPWFSKKKTPED